jgi:hypothetical protein
MASDTRLPSDAFGRRLLDDEARAMLTRLARVRSFALHETMVPAAAVSVAAQAAIERALAEGRRELRRRIRSFLAWLSQPAGRRSSLQDGHRRLSFLRLRFNAVLSHFDVFSIVMTQRSEHGIGVWLSGLDVASRDALTLERDVYEMPPIVCYLDRGFGAAIRRARTRLPGGGETPVAIIRVPRERMVGSGIASSLVHEVGHQAAALLDLVNPLRARLQAVARRQPRDRDAWHMWELWISEIVADLWSVALVGVGSTLGLMGVLSLPRTFVFRAVTDDPHPIPWVRVQLSCALGQALYPDPQWARVSGAWSSYYPTDGLSPRQRSVLARLEETMPAFVELLLDHRPALLGGGRLVDALPLRERTPARLRELRAEWESRGGWRDARPALAFAVMGQARADGRMTPEREGRLVAALLEHWALRTTIDTSEACALGPAPRHMHRNQPTASFAAAGVA